MTNFSYQLYSSRNFPPLSNVLKDLADLGFTQVEGFRGLFETLDEARKLRADLDANGLTMPTAHMNLDVLESAPETAVDIAKALGIGYVFVPHIDAAERPNDADGWRAFGQRLAEAGKPLEVAGIRVGWHNHDFEFTHGADTHPLDYILEGGPELAFEFDLAWGARAGEDHIKWIEKYADRIVAAHIKDIAPVGQNSDEDGWADIGDGTINWPETFAALAQSNCQYFVLEHDNPSDGPRFASRSIAYLNTF